MLRTHSSPSREEFWDSLGGQLLALYLFLLAVYGPVLIVSWVFGWIIKAL